MVASVWKDFNNIIELPITGFDRITTTKLNLYPNPATDGFLVSGIKGTSKISVFDLSGKLLLTKEIADNEYFSVSMLPQGVYIVRINSEAGTLEKKIMKN